MCSRYVWSCVLTHLTCSGCDFHTWSCGWPQIQSLISALLEQVLVHVVDHIWLHLWSPVTIMCFIACLTMCLIAYLTLQLLFLQLLSEMSILQLVPSVLMCCLFFNSALAVRGRRLLASRISSHLDAVLSIFVSQCAGPHFLVDESRVPVCAGSNSVSFQHTTVLWDGRKSN